MLPSSVRSKGSKKMFPVFAGSPYNGASVKINTKKKKKKKKEKLNKKMLPVFGGLGIRD